MKRRCSTLVVVALSLSACGRSPSQPVEPALQLDPPTVRFVARPNQVVEAAAVSVVGSGGLALPFRAVADAPWVVVTPREGTTPAVVQVSVKTFGVPLGTNVAAVRFVMPEAEPGAPVAGLTVQLELSSPGWSPLDELYAAAPTWLAVAPDDPTLVLAATARGALLRSTDGGQSFTRVELYPGSHDPIWSVALASGGVGYCGGVGGVWRTNDAGASWSATALQNVRIDTVVIDPDDAARGLAEGDTAFFTNDGWASYAEIPGSPDPYFARLDPTGTATFLLGGTGGVVYVTEGASLTALTQFQATSPVVGFLVTATGRWLLSSRGLGSSSERATLVVSDDQGASWTAKNTGLPRDNSPSWFAVWRDGDTLWVGHETGLYRSVDDGESYARVTPPPAHGSGEGPWPEAMVRAGERLLFALDGEGVFTLGAGDVWTRARQNDLSVRDLAFASTTGELFVATNIASVYRWSPGAGFIGIAGVGLDFHSYSELDQILPDPRNSAVIWLAGYGSGLQRTEDGGLTWARTASNVDEYVYHLTRSHLDPDVFWAGAEGGIYLSTDAGLIFTQLNTRGAGQAAVVDADTALFESGGDILRVESSGAFTTVWTNDDGNARSVVAGPDGSFWGLGDGSGLLRSTDGGQSFTRVGWREVRWGHLTIDPGDPERLFVATEQGASISEDGGVTFTDLGCPFAGDSLALDSANRRLFVGTAFGGVWVYAY